MNKRFLAILTAAIFVLPLVLFGASGPKQDIKVTKIGNKKGPAIYSHPKHEKAGITNCKECHHQGNQDDPCAKCHDLKKDPKGKKHLHDNCKGCHQKMKKGPTKCNDCHQKK